MFLSPDDKAGLAQFCQRHAVPLTARLDVWGNLLEPFLAAPAKTADYGRA